MGSRKIVRVVIDTNVIVSGLLFGGTPGVIVDLWKSGQIQPIASPEIVNEYLRVLSYPKFNLSEQEISFLIYHEILPHFEIVRKEYKHVQIINKDPSDDKFIYCALCAKGNAIISGDQHLINLKSFKGIKILSPTEFLRQFRGGDVLK